MKRPIDIEKIATLLAELRNSTNELQAFLNLSREEFVNTSALPASKYYLSISAEICVNISEHIIARQKFQVPESALDAIRILAHNGILTNEVALQIAEAVKLRNMLIHLYWKVDNERIFEFLQKNLDDFAKFDECIVRYMTSAGKSNS